MGATCSRHAPRSHMPDFSRSNARGRGDLHSDLPKLRMDVPKHGRPGIRQDWRGMSAASSPFRQKGDSRLAATGRSGFRQRRSTGWAGRVQYQHRHSRSARRCACSAGRMTGRPRYSARRAKVGFGGEFGSNRAARADGTGVGYGTVSREQLARMERDLAAHTAALGTADAAKWVKRPDYCLTQPRATITMNMPTGP